MTRRRHSPVRPVGRTPLRRSRAGAIAVLAALVVALSGCGVLRDGAYDLPLPGGPDAGPNPDTITVHFASVDGLVPKSMVKVGNIAVGVVESIDLDPDTWTATVTCRIRNDVGLPANAVAQVRRSSLLGEWFVELSPPAGNAAAAPLSDGADIPLASTGQTAPVEEVLGALSLLLSNGGVPQLNTIVKELNTAFSGRGPQLRSLLQELDTFTGQLDSRSGDIVAALDSLEKLGRTLDRNKADIAQALDELPAGVRVLADQRRQLVATLASLDRLSKVAVRVVRTSSADTVADLKALQPTLTKLAEAGTNLPNALKIMLTFPFTPGTLDGIKGDFVNLHVALNLDLSSVVDTITRSGTTPLAGLVPDPSAILGPGAGNTPLDLGSLAGTTASAPSAGTSTGESGTTPGTGTATSGSGGGLGGLLGALGLGGSS